MKKDEKKWCGYHKIPWHNNKECHSKKSLMAELKASDSKVDSDFKSNPRGGKRIIDVEPISTVSTTKVQPSEPEKPKEGKHLFHSHMWVKGLCFISLSIATLRRT
jgi:hypothetical protein